MRLAVIIPVKDRAELLKRTLDALWAAAKTAPDTGSSLSVIVVDNGSTDQSRETAQRHSIRARLIDCDATTVSAVRNAGANAATAPDAFVFLDCDCEVPPNFFTAVEHAFEVSGASAVGCEVRSPVDGHWTERTWDQLHRPGGDGPRHYINSACFSIRREWFERLKGFDPSRGSSEDVDICRRLTLAGGTMWQSESLAVLHLGNPQTVGGLYRRVRWHGSGIWQRGKSYQWSPTSVATLLHGVSVVVGSLLAGLLWWLGKPVAAVVAAVAGLLFIPTGFVFARAVQFRRRVPILGGVALMMLTFTARLDALFRALSRPLSDKRNS